MVLLVHSLCIREEGVRGRGKFSIKTLYSVLELGILFQQVLLGTLGYYRRWAFCLGGYLGKGFDLGSFKEERMVFGLKKCFLRHLEEESIDHIHIHYVITRVLWHLLFSLFGVSWVLSSLVIEMLLR